MKAVKQTNTTAKVGMTKKKYITVSPVRMFGPGRLRNPVARTAK